MFPPMPETTSPDLEGYQFSEKAQSRGNILIRLDSESPDPGDYVKTLELVLKKVSAPAPYVARSSMEKAVYTWPVWHTSAGVVHRWIAGPAQLVWGPA